MIGNTLFIATTILSLLAIDTGEIYASEKLKKTEFIDLLSGNTVKGYYMVEGQQQSVLMGRVGIKIKLFNDGSAEKTTYRAKGSKGAFTEKGRWSVNKQGKLCVIWIPENKQRCGHLERAANGKYELLRKKQKIFYEEMIPGT